MRTERLSIATRQVLALILIGAAARIVLAWVLGLGVDESYEVVMARTPALSYFDHPPLSFWIAGLTARLAGTENRVVLRLPFIALFAASTWIMYRLTFRLYGERAGLLAALFLNLSPVFSLSTGGWILPDGPLDFAILLATLCFIGVLSAGSWAWWLGAGFATGIALLSKYHGIFFVAGALLFLATSPSKRQWFRRPEPYAAALVALILSSPVLVWNAQHHFASLRFQGGRAAVHGIHLTALAQNVAGQLGYVFPWIGLPLLWQLWRGLRTGPSDESRWLLTILAVGPIVLFTVISLGGNPGLPHWPAPGYLLLFPLLGDAAARYERRGADERLLIRRWAVGSTVVFVSLTAVAASAVATGWPSRVVPSLFRRGDPTLEAIDWRDLGPDLHAMGVLHPGVLVGTTHWIDGAKVGYALGPSYAVFCLSDDPRGFLYNPRRGDTPPRDVLILARVGRDSPEERIRAQFGPYFGAIESVGTARVARAGEVVIRIAVFRARQR